ncbi:FkbM family methyltransferase [Sphingomonas colocasiae]|uniref:FkbM family methyltransferase n=1 Tax=Sphingomonas colocasiae TaxID=1848973 RepID=A0ABS7PHM7_9SPHN|nr:FkbM family methyltransferase [Sphingomonas colocasiae]MBY8820796.1 FkbM family methyltransferase [Sphingomonas colocasiae]
MSVKQLPSSPLKGLLSRKAIESSSSAGRLLARLGLRAVAPFGADSIVFDAGGYSMLLPVSHPLPRYWRGFPNYDRALPRLVRSLSALTQSKEFVIVDIGANVGDTAVALLQHPATFVVAIEGNDAFLPHLRQNLSAFTNRSAIIERFIGPKTAESFVVETCNGTAKLIHADDGVESSVDMIGLDEALALSNKDDIDLIKIDTDGFDIQIIMNSLAMLNSSNIPIFFEFDPNLAKPVTGDAWIIFDTLLDIGYSYGIAYVNTGEILRCFRVNDQAAIDEMRAFLSSATPSAYLDLIMFKDVTRFDHARASELAHFTGIDTQFLIIPQ